MSYALHDSFAREVMNSIGHSKESHPAIKMAQELMTKLNDSIDDQGKMNAEMEPVGSLLSVAIYHSALVALNRFFGDLDSKMMVAIALQQKVFERRGETCETD